MVKVWSPACEPSRARVPGVTVEADRLRDLPLFSGLSNIEREYVAAWLETRSARPGDRVVAEGAAGYEFFIIEEGTAEVVQDGEGIRALGPGDFFGEMALVRLHAARTPAAS